MSTTLVAVGVLGPASIICIVCLATNSTEEILFFSLREEAEKTKPSLGESQSGW